MPTRTEIGGGARELSGRVSAQGRGISTGASGADEDPATSLLPSRGAKLRAVPASHEAALRKRLPPPAQNDGEERLGSEQNGGTPTNSFADAVIDWFEIHGRHDLPWQTNPSPYRVWVSEIMLQQTRVSTVIPYFRRFMARFPDVSALAAADIDVVLHLWTGLGYYARARNLHKAARTIIEEHCGRIPNTVAELEQLPGIGRSTAGAIVALAHGRPAPILDGNAQRVLARCFAIEGYPGSNKTRSKLWALAEQLLPRESENRAGDTHAGRSRIGDTQPDGRAGDAPAGATRNRITAYTQGMMDLGATLCVRANPDCPRCPLQHRCVARRRGETKRYPGKKPTKVLPIRAVTMFILQDREGRVLLEKRPPNGIWASLYSLPQIETGDGTPTPNKDGMPMLPTELFGLRLAGGRTVEPAPIRHGFTHFQLDITPIHYRVTQTASAAADSDRWLWYSIAQPAEIGLAAPVRKLLAALAATEARRLGSSMKKEKP